MSSFTLTPLAVEPYFDLELLLSISQETRVGGAMMEQLSAAWERWVPQAHAQQVTTADGSYLLVWLGDIVESDVDEKWDSSPSEAFLYNALAQVMCMGLVHSLVPEVEDAGCAPAPKPTELLAQAIATEGISYLTPGEPALSRRFGVLTHYPYQGGCELCALYTHCPKAGGTQCGPAGVVLPGFE